MLRRDKLLIGFAVGAVLPVLAYFLLSNLFAVVAGLTDFPLEFRERTLTLVAVCVNLLPFRAYNGMRATQAMRGVLLATGLYAIAWIVQFGIALLNEA